MKQVSSIRGLIIAILLAAMPFFSLSQNPHWNQYGGYYEVVKMINDGNSIWATTTKDIIKMDQDGNILKRFSYDGISPHGMAYSIAVDRNGDPWFCFLNSNKIMKIQDTVCTVINSFPSIEPYHISFDTLNQLWVYNYEGLWCYNGNSWTNHDNALLNSSIINNLKADANNNIWMGTYNGLIKYDGMTWTLYDTSNSGILYNDIRGMAFDSDNNLWLVNGALIKFDGTNWTYYNSTNSPLPSGFYGEDLYIDNSNRFWVNLYYQGISMFDGTNYFFYNKSNSSLLHNNVTSITQGNNGKMFFGTCYAITTLDNSIWENIISSNYPGIGFDINGITEDSQGSIWFTCFSDDTISNNAGAYRFDDNSFTYYYMSNSGMPSNRVFDVKEDLQGIMWFCTDSGVCRYDGSNWIVYNSTNSTIISDYALCVAVDSSNNKWFGLEWGLARYNDTTWTLYDNTNCPYDFTYVQDIAVDFNNNIWINSGDPSDQLVRYNDGIWTNYTSSNSGLLPNWINALEVDRNNNILISYYMSHSISKFNRFSWWTTITPPTGSMSIEDVKMDMNGNLWLLCNYELFKYNGIYWEKFDGNNSPMGSCSALSLFIDSKGRKWIGGNGITLFTESNLLYRTYRISGKIYYDENENGIKDSAEVYLTGQKMKLLPDTAYALTTYTKKYNFFVPWGNYTVQYVPQAPWQLSSGPGSFHVLVSTADTTLPDIGVIVPDTTIFDIDVTLMATTCNTSQPLCVSFINNGSSTEGVIGFLPDSLTLVMQSNPPVDSVSANGIYWYHFSGLMPGEEGQIWLQLLMPDFTHIGDTIMFAAMLQSDGYIFTDTTYAIHTCSFDPNDKSVWPAGILSSHYTLRDTPLEYTIRFQNTGNDFAQNIIITDTLSPWLDINSFEFISSSHPADVNLYSDGRLIFYFTDIYLPDSCNNEPASHGFVKFSIKPKYDIPENTVINNTANIYFDYNPPVITENVFNTIVSVLPAGIIDADPFSASDVRIYPNPTNGKFNIRNSTGIKSIEIMSLLGERILIIKPKEFNADLEINLSDYPAGVYIIKIDDGHYSYNRKVVLD